MTAEKARPSLVLAVKPGQYSDGHPLDEVHYLECKLILKPERFTSAEAFRAFATLVQQAATANGIGLDSKCVAGMRPSLREVEFLDTADFRLYNNAFILRRRTTYQDFFPAGDAEIVFKFRHPDLQTAAEMDVRPNIAGDYRVKFKAEALPLRDQLGGYRLLYSHNVELGLSQTPEGDRMAMASLVRMLPALATLRTSADDRVELVNQAVVEEVLQELGVLDLGKGIVAKCNVALWRTRAEHQPLVAEFAYQAKFKRHDALHDHVIEHNKRFFIALQQLARDWVSLGTTKTGMVYRLKGNPPQSHE